MRFIIWHENIILTAANLPEHAQHLQQELDNLQDAESRLAHLQYTIESNQ